MQSNLTLTQQAAATRAAAAVSSPMSGYNGPAMSLDTEEHGVDVDVVVNADADADGYAERSFVSIETTRSRMARGSTKSSGAITPRASNASRMAAHSSAEPRAIV
jgi:hypothetical protein